MTLNNNVTSLCFTLLYSPYWFGWLCHEDSESFLQGDPLSRVLVFWREPGRMGRECRLPGRVHFLKNIFLLQPCDFRTSQPRRITWAIFNTNLVFSNQSQKGPIPKKPYTRKGQNLERRDNYWISCAFWWKQCAFETIESHKLLATIFSAIGLDFDKMVIMFWALLFTANSI